MAEKKRIDNKILIESIIALVAFIIVGVVFFKSYFISPKIAVGQFTIVLIAALMINLILHIKGFFEYFRTFITIFALVPMIPFSFISGLLSRQMPPWISYDQLLIMFFVDMLPLIIVTLLLLVVSYQKEKCFFKDKVNIMILFGTIIPLFLSFIRKLSCFAPVLRQVLGVSMVMSIMYNYKELRELYPKNKWLSYLPLLILCLRVIYLFSNKSYY